MNALLLFLILAVPGEILVLKNGKTMRCDRYENQGKKVMVYRKGDKFALPTQMIDWDKSKAAQAAQAQKDKADEAAREAAKNKAATTDLGAFYAGKPKKSKSISITNETMGERGVSSFDQPEVIRYQTRGNSILVKVSINGGLPKDFILDTGAAITLVSPSLAGEVGLRPNGALAVHGVGGSGMAQTAEATSIALGKARVNNMTVVIRNIPVLAQTQIQGLLGQDFLNNFTMSLDSAAQTVTLSPNGGRFRGKSEAEIVAAFEQIMPDLERMVQRVSALTHSYLEGRIYTGADKALGEFKGQLPGMTVRLREYREMLGKVDTTGMDPDERKEIKTLAACLHFYESALDRLSRHITLLRRVLHSRDTSFAQEVSSSWNKVAGETEQFEICMNGR